MKNYKTSDYIYMLISGIGRKIFVLIFILVFVTSGIDIGEANASPIDHSTLSPGSVFSDLSPVQIKHNVMLEYTVLAGEKNSGISISENENNITNLDLGIDFNSGQNRFGEKLKIAFLCRNAEEVFVGDNSIKLIPSIIEINDKKTKHWYCKFDKIVRKDGADFVFFTDEEKNDPQFLTNLKYAYMKDHSLERTEQPLISRASRSEFEHDEKIRKAIRNKECFVIDYTNYRNTLLFINMFLRQISKTLAQDFMHMVNDGQLMAITSKGENAISSPHAGGKGIYLPNDAKFINPETIIYAVFTKAGFDKKESDVFVDIFEAFIKSLANDNINCLNGTRNDKKTEELISEAEYAVFSDESVFAKINDEIRNDKTKLTKPELVDLNREIIATKSGSQNGKNRFVDLTENIKTRDYSYRKKELLRFKASQKGLINGAIAEQLLSMIEHHEHQIFWIMNKKGKIIYVNGAIKNVLGYSPEELEDEITQKKILAPESTEKVRQYLTETKNSIAQRNAVGDKMLNLKYICKDGTSKWLEVVGHVNYDTENSPIFVGSSYDITPLQYAQRDASESQQIINDINIAIYRSTPEGGFSKVNPMMETLLGYSHKELMNMPIETIYNNPADRAKFLTEISNKKKVEDWEVEMIKKDGTIISCNITGRGSFDAHGKLQWIDGTIRDVSDLKDMERSEKIKNTLLQIERDISIAANKTSSLGNTLLTIMENIVKAEHIDSGGFYFYNGSSLELDCSIGLSYDFRNTVSHIPEKDPRMILAMEMFKERKALFSNYNEIMKVTGREKNPDGLEGFASIPIIHDDEFIGLWNLASKKYDKIPEVYHDTLESIAGWIGGIIVNAQLAEEKKAFEEALLRSEMNQTLIIENMLSGLVTLDPDGKIVNANPAYLKTTGVEKVTDITGVNMFDFLEYVEPGITKKIADGRGVKVEIKIDFKDPKIEGWLNNKTSRGGKEKPEDYIYVTCLVARSGIRHDGRYGYTMNFLDVTERKKLEEELKHFAAETSTVEKLITEKMKAVSEYAPRISHDMNNIISSINGNIGLANLKLSEYDGQTEGAAEKVISDVTRYIANIEEGINKLTDMAARYLNMSKVKEEGVRACFVESSLESVVDFRKNQIDDAGIKVNVDLSGTFPIVMIDEVLAQGVFLNLIMNAESFMTKAYLADADKKELTIKTETFTMEGTEYLRVYIKDTGKGLDDGEEEKVFEPFFTNRKDSSGTGMGLAGVREVVEKAGGKVYAKNNEQKGAVFIVELPLYKPELKIIGEIINNDLNIAMEHGLLFMSSLLREGAELIDSMIGELDLSKEQMPVIRERIDAMISDLDSIKSKRSIAEWGIVLGDIEAKAEEIYVLRHQLLPGFNVENNSSLLQSDKLLQSICEDLVKWSYDMKKMQKGFKDVEDKKGESFRKIDFVKNIRTIVQQLSGEKTVLPQINAGVINLNLDDRLNYNKKILVSANESLLGLAIYKIMMLEKGYDEELILNLNPVKRDASIDVKLSKNNDNINMLFTNNSFIFKKEQLEKEVSGNDQINPRILKWEGINSNPLAAANYIISFFGGDIKLWNNEDATGSYISVTIPCCVRNTKVQKKKGRSFISSPDGELLLKPAEKGKMIVVDDNPAVLDISLETLRQEGFDVHGFGSVEEIMDAIEGGLDISEFKLGLIDVQLGKDSGVDLVIMLRKKGVHLPVILMSGYPLTKEFQNMINRGEIADFLQKPVRFKDDAMPKINRILEGNISRSSMANEISAMSQNVSVLIFGEDEGKRQAAKSRLKSMGMQNAKFFEAWDKDSLNKILYEQSIIMIVDVSKKGIQDLLDQIFGNIAERPPVIEDLQDIEKTKEIQRKILTYL